jgi:mannose-6-phosphate isomerase-like protein (cupin superfamily)
MSVDDRERSIPDRARLPLTFDADAMAHEAAALDPSRWEAHFNTGYYQGDWSGVALRRTVGAPLDLYPDPTRDEYEDTEALAACPNVRAALARFDCPLQTVRFLRLGPGSTIEEHRDHALSWSHREVRLHVPLVTDDEVTFWLDGEVVPMRKGECWYLDLTRMHRVTNTGAVARLHLVIDAKVNDWLTEQLRA